MKKKAQITILTLPISDGSDYLRQNLWLTARKLNYWRKFQRPPQFGGHYAVTRSVVEGMTKAGLPVNFNPKLLCDVSERVHVLAGVQPLRQMIRWKREGLINQLTCGPNIVVRSSDYDSLIASNEINAVINHSEWLKEFWAKDHPELRQRYLKWPVGVDESFWAYRLNEQRKAILIFDKSLYDHEENDIEFYIKYIESCNYRVITLSRNKKNYRNAYTLDFYRSLLHQSCLLVGFTVGSETQGIAWAEAWAADVPTLIYQQNKRVISGLLAECTTAPYLTALTGDFFNHFEDFKCRFDAWRNGSYSFNPREWVLSNMTDEFCARDLFEKLTNLSKYLYSIDS